MSVRRHTTNRLTLYRHCGICGRGIVTTADTPFMRQISEGGRQITKYYCSEGCKSASYKHKFDGKAEERRREKEARRDIQEKNRRYYAAHSDKERMRARERYWADPDKARADMAYQRKKRALITESIEIGIVRTNQNLELKENYNGI